MLVRVSVLSEAQCGNIAARLNYLRPEWIWRAPGFYTLGVATYLDIGCAENPEASYYGRVAATNGLLRREFGDELAALQRSLCDTLQAPCRFASGLALPGFHIFECGGICTSGTPTPHFDLQYQYHQWPFALAASQFISFTLTISLPRLGGGLDVWEIEAAELARLERMGRKPTVERLSRLVPHTHHAYQPGWMVVQLATLLHRIAPLPEAYPGDQRITWQGHGVLDQGEWVLYW